MNSGSCWAVPMLLKCFTEKQMTRRSRLRRNARPSVLQTLAQICSVFRLFSDGMRALKGTSYPWEIR
uniref:Alternative protein SPTA1 n=1 Tax=Homo sapiens TaxID=9606 RepID=L8E8Z3_HUMAN|nr:alternative protein SPTA1 [Homo sapiens]